MSIHLINLLISNVQASHFYLVWKVIMIIRLKTGDGNITAVNYQVNK